MADQKYPPLPEGFVLEQPGNTAPAGMPPLPPGFELMPSAGPSPSGHPSFEEGQALLNAEEQQQRMQGASGTVGATLTGLAEGVPIAGPALLGAGQRGAAIASTVMNGGTYDENLKQAQDITQQAQDAHPWVTTGANVAGGVASMLPVASTALGARALGVTGETLLGRTAASALSGTGIGAADAAARTGGDLTDTAKGALTGLLFGVAAPTAGALIGAGTRTIRRHHHAEHDSGRWRSYASNLATNFSWWCRCCRHSPNGRLRRSNSDRNAVRPGRRPIT